MMKVSKIDSTEKLNTLKHQYLEQTTAPLDGMWLSGFVPMASHYGFYDEEKLAGFCCVNDKGYLLQFFLAPQFQSQSADVFASLLDDGSSPTGTIKGAFVSTAEPESLSLCVDRFASFEVNALMYRLDRESAIAQEADDSLTLVPIASEQLRDVVEFAVASIGAPEEWLTGYYTTLINRGELFGHWKEGRLLATGESRGNDEYQTGFADLGVVVAPSQRGQGLATRVLRQLVTLTAAKGLESICSTEKTNLAAQKAIARAGFVARNRIIQFKAQG